MAGYSVVVEGLVKRYGMVYALRGLSFRVGRGEVYGLLGPNGAGKTTTIRALAGALRPSRGRILVAGVDPLREPVAAKRVVGVVPELPSLFPELTVWENLALIARVYGIPRGEARRRIREVLELAGLEGFESRRYASLSKGLKRRADIAAALIHDPEVLLLDEPTGGLDVVAAARLREGLRSLRRRGVTIVLSTHNIEEAVALSDRLMLLYRGSKLAEGPPGMFRRALSTRRVTLYYTGPPPGDLEALLAEALEPYGARDVRVGRGTVSFTVKKVVEALEEAKRILAARGLRVEDLEVLPPSWEDVLRIHFEAAERGGCPGCPCGAVGA